MNRMTRRHHRAGGCRLPLTALLLLRAGALLWAAAHAHAHAALLRGAAAAASPEAFPTASELRPVLPAAAPPLSTAPTADPVNRQPVTWAQRSVFVRVPVNRQPVPWAQRSARVCPLTINRSVFVRVPVNRQPLP